MIYQTLNLLHCLPTKLLQVMTARQCICVAWRYVWRSEWVSCVFGLYPDPGCCRDLNPLIAKLIQGDAHTLPAPLGGEAADGGTGRPAICLLITPWVQGHAWLGTMVTRKYWEPVDNDCFEDYGIKDFFSPSPFVKQHGCRFNVWTLSYLNAALLWHCSDSQPDCCGDEPGGLWQSLVFDMSQQHVILPAEASCQVIPQIPGRNQSRGNKGFFYSFSRVALQPYLILLIGYSVVNASRPLLEYPSY